jgi:Tol biopolymer transport system component
MGWLAAAVLGAGATAAAFVLLQRHRATIPAQVMRLEITTPPTTDPESFALAPDGQTIAFVANVDSVSRLWVRPLREASARPLPETDGATQPFWSPDNRSIGFFADHKLKRVDVASGSPQVLADAPTPRGGAWNRNGVIVFAPCTPCGLVQVPAIGGQVTPLSAPVTGQALSHRWPEFLPDGRLLFAGLLGPIGSRGIYLASLDGTAPIRIVDSESGAAFAPPDHLLLLRQATLVAVRFDPVRGVVSDDPVAIAEGLRGVRGPFSVSATGLLAYRSSSVDRRELVWMDRAGTTLQNIVPADESEVSSPALGPDGRRVIVQRFMQGNVDLWSVNLANGVPTRLTFDPAAEAHAVWSPDGRRIVFGAAGNGRDGLRLKTLSVGGEDQPLAVESKAIPVDWSPDGRFILYQAQGRTTGGDLWATPLDGGPPFAVVQTPSDESGGQFSPDGQWIAYQSDGSGRTEIYVQPFPGPGQPVQVSRAGGSQVRWGRSGRELFYIGLDARLTVVPVRTVDQSLEPAAPVPLFEARLATGPNTIPGRPQYAVAADGRFLMNIRVGDTDAPPIAIVSNWLQLLKEP